MEPAEPSHSSFAEFDNGLTDDEEEDDDDDEDLRDVVSRLEGAGAPGGDDYPEDEEEGSSEEEEADFELASAPPAGADGEAEQKAAGLSREMYTGYRVLRDLMSPANHQLNWPFMDTVDTSKRALWDYTDIIKQPMWLSKVRDKLLSGEYTTMTEVFRDLRLMLRNCYRYNGPQHSVTRRALRLEQLIEQHVQQMEPDLRELCTLQATEGEDAVVSENLIPTRRSKRSKKPSYFSHVLFLVRGERAERDKEYRRRQLELRKEQRERREERIVQWEHVLLDGCTGDRLRAMWELPQLAQFVHLSLRALNVLEVPLYEMERMLLVPQSSETLAMLMTSLVSAPLVRMRLGELSPMPYSMWTTKLAARTQLWYRAYNRERGDTRRLLAMLGIEPAFWTIVGERNPFETTLFHQFSFYQRVWMLKSLCDYLFHSHKSIQDCVMEATLAEPRETVVGRDRHGFEYLHFPQLLVQDVRVYRRRPWRAPPSWSQPPADPPPLPAPPRLVAAGRKWTKAKLRQLKRKLADLRQKRHSAGTTPGKPRKYTCLTAGLVAAQSDVSEEEDVPAEAGSAADGDWGASPVKKGRRKGRICAATSAGSSRAGSVTPAKRRRITLVTTPAKRPKSQPTPTPTPVNATDPDACRHCGVQIRSARARNAHRCLQKQAVEQAEREEAEAERAALISRVPDRRARAHSRQTSETDEQSSSDDTRSEDEESGADDSSDDGEEAASDCDVATEMKHTGDSDSNTVRKRRPSSALSVNEGSDGAEVFEASDEEAEEEAGGQVWQIDNPAMFEDAASSRGRDDEDDEELVVPETEPNSPLESDSGDGMGRSESPEQSVDESPRKPLKMKIVIPKQRSATDRNGNGMKEALTNGVLESASGPEVALTNGEVAAKTEEIPLNLAETPQDRAISPSDTELTRTKDAPDGAHSRGDPIDVNSRSLRKADTYHVSEEAPDVVGKGEGSVGTPWDVAPPSAGPGGDAPNGIGVPRINAEEHQVTRPGDGSSLYNLVGCKRLPERGDIPPKEDVYETSQSGEEKVTDANKTKERDMGEQGDKPSYPIGVGEERVKSENIDMNAEHVDSLEPAPCPVQTEAEDANVKEKYSEITKVAFSSAQCEESEILKINKSKEEPSLNSISKDVNGMSGSGNSIVSTHADLPQPKTEPKEAPFKSKNAQVSDDTKQALDIPDNYDTRQLTQTELAVLSITGEVYPAEPESGSEQHDTKLDLAKALNNNPELKSEGHHDSKADIAVAGIKLDTENRDVNGEDAQDATKLDITKLFDSNTKPKSESNKPEPDTTVAVVKSDSDNSNAVTPVNPPDQEMPPLPVPEIVADPTHLPVPDPYQFKLVADTFDSLRQLIVSFTPLPHTTKKKKERQPACEVELRAELQKILDELQPLEAKINTSVRRMRKRLCQEWISFVNRPADAPEPGADVWADPERPGKPAAVQPPPSPPPPKPSTTPPTPTPSDGELSSQEDGRRRQRSRRAKQKRSELSYREDEHHPQPRKRPREREPADQPHMQVSSRGRLRKVRKMDDFDYEEEFMERPVQRAAAVVDNEPEAPAEGADGLDLGEEDRNVPAPPGAAAGGPSLAWNSELPVLPRGRPPRAPSARGGARGREPWRYRATAPVRELASPSAGSLMRPVTYLKAVPPVSPATPIRFAPVRPVAPVRSTTPWRPVAPWRPMAPRRPLSRPPGHPQLPARLGRPPKQPQIQPLLPAAPPGKRRFIVKLATDGKMYMESLNGTPLKIVPFGAQSSSAAEAPDPTTARDLSDKQPVLVRSLPVGKASTEAASSEHSQEQAATPGGESQPVILTTRSPAARVSPAGIRPRVVTARPMTQPVYILSAQPGVAGAQPMVFGQTVVVSGAGTSIRVVSQPKQQDITTATVAPSLALTTGVSPSLAPTTGSSSLIPTVSPSLTSTTVTVSQSLTPTTVIVSPPLASTTLAAAGSAAVSTTPAAVTNVVGELPSLSPDLAAKVKMVKEQLESMNMVLTSEKAQQFALRIVQQAQRKMIIKPETQEAKPPESSGPSLSGNAGPLRFTVDTTRPGRPVVKQVGALSAPGVRLGSTQGTTVGSTGVGTLGPVSPSFRPRLLALSPRMRTPTVRRGPATAVYSHQSHQPHQHTVVSDLSDLTVSFEDTATTPANTAGSLGAGSVQAQNALNAAQPSEHVAASTSTPSVATPEGTTLATVSSDQCVTGGPDLVNITAPAQQTSGDIGPDSGARVPSLTNPVPAATHSDQASSGEAQPSAAVTADAAPPPAATARAGGEAPAQPGKIVRMEGGGLGIRLASGVVVPLSAQQVSAVKSEALKRRQMLAAAAAPQMS